MDNVSGIYIYIDIHMLINLLIDLLIHDPLRSRLKLNQATAGALMSSSCAPSPLLFGQDIYSTCRIYSASGAPLRLAYVSHPCQPSAFRT
jgi:hypothetical protein